jgi:small conductance mechanosensitive channel
MRHAFPATPWIHVAIVSALLVTIATLATGQQALGDSDGAEVVDPVELPEAGAPGADGEAAAEEATPEEPPTPRLVRTARNLVRQLEAVRAEVNDLERDLERAEGEDALVLEKQTIAGKLEFLELFGRMVENLLEQEASGLDAGEFRAQIATWLMDMRPSIIRHIESAEARITDLRKTRESTPPDQLMGFEQRLAKEVEWLDDLYGAYADNIAHLAALELPDQEARDDLSERLARRTALVGGRLELALEQLAQLAERAVERPDDPEVAAETAALQKRRENVAKTLSILIELMEPLGLDPTRYQQLLITGTGEVTSDIFKPRVAIGLVQEWLDSVRDWARDNGPGLLMKIFVFLLILSIARLLSIVTRRLLIRAFAAPRVHASALLQRMMISISSNLVFFLGLLVGLSQLGLELGPLLAGLGIAGFIVGFALQDSLSNFAAGMLILGYRPFDVGDMIEAAGVRGEVSHMSLVNTTILTIDNRTLIVPNNKIWGDVITNITHQKRRRVDMRFGISYADDVDHAERVFKDIVTSHPKVLDDPEPMVKLHELCESSVDFVVRPWVKTEDYWDVYWDVTREVKCRFDAEGITIPLPRRQLYVQDDSRARKGA